MQVIFNTLKIKNFRQITEREFEFDPKTNFIIGKNGSGKTNTLHAITWVLFGKDLDDRSKFAVVPLNPDNTVTELEPDVSMTLTVDGEPHSIRRLLKGGNTTQVYIDDMPCRTLKEYDTFIASIFQTPDRFKIYTNPLHFPNMNWKDQRELFMRFFPEPPREAVLARMEERQGYAPELKERLTNDNLERLGDMLAQEKKDLESERTKIRNQVELLDEQLEGYQRLDEDKLDAERKELREQIRTINETIKTATDHNAKIETARNHFTSKRSEALRKLEFGKSDVEHLRQRDIRSREIEIEKLEAERSALQEAYIALKDEAQICGACGQDLPKKQIDRQKIDLTDKGIALAEMIRRKQGMINEIMSKPVEVADANELVETANAAEQELIKLENLIDVPVLDDTLLERLDELDKTLARADVHKENIERKQKMSDRLREINRTYEKTEVHLREVADFLFYRSELIVEAVNSQFVSISVKVLDIQKNGIAKETFEILKDGVPYAELNTAGQLEAGLELTDFIKSNLDIYCPVLIDNGERFTDLDLQKVKGQLIATKAIKGKELEIAYKI